MTHAEFIEPLPLEFQFVWMLDLYAEDSDIDFLMNKQISSWEIALVKIAFVAWSSYWSFDKPMQATLS